MATALAVRSSHSELQDLFRRPEDEDADDALQELNSYLSRLSDEDLRSLRSRRSSTVSEWLGDCCRDCRGAEHPLVYAVETNHVNCLREIMRAQPNLDLAAVRLDSGGSLVHAAARRGSLDTLQLLADSNQSLCSVADQRGATPIHACAYYGYVECLENVLDRGCEANTRDHEGAAPIHFAAVSGHLECLKKLFASGDVDVNATTESGETPG